MKLASKEWVMDLLTKLFNRTVVSQQENKYKGVKFQFAVDADGNYGYIKDGADTVTPFKTGDGGGGSITSRPQFEYMPFSQIKLNSYEILEEPGFGTAIWGYEDMIKYNRSSFPVTYVPQEYIFSKYSDIV